MRSSMVVDADFAGQQAEIRHLKMENANLKQELKWLVSNTKSIGIPV